MHPSPPTFVPRLSNLFARSRALTSRPSSARLLIPPATVVAVPHVDAHAPKVGHTLHAAPKSGFFRRMHRPSPLPAPMIAWNDHLRMV